MVRSNSSARSRSARTLAVPVGIAVAGGSTGHRPARKATACTATSRHVSKHLAGGWYDNGPRWRGQGHG